jgi:DNA-directed RNA polymerase specialized sigma24 family protein
VAGLGGRKQLALELYQFQDRSCAEVAEVLHMTAKGAKSLLFRARQELRDALVGLLA